MRYETVVCPTQFRWDDWRTGQFGKIEDALDRMNDGVAALETAFDIAGISVVSAFGYLDSRFADLDWRHGRVPLAGWFAKVSLRPSVAATIPIDGSKGPLQPRPRVPK
ncbi:glutathione S-transferase C-terminal domain-containing protein [Devosia sp. A449]